MSNENPAGSTWKKWDLHIHIHSPSSIVQNYGGNSDAAWEAFLADLERLPPEFKVIGINDYIFIEGYERVRKAKREQGRLKNIDLILPVVELRLDKFAGVVTKDEHGNYSQSDWNRINLHVIFDELDPEVIRAKVNSGVQHPPTHRMKLKRRGSAEAVDCPAPRSRLRRARPLTTARCVRCHGCAATTSRPPR